LEKYTVIPLCTEEGYWWLEVVTDEPDLYLFGPFDEIHEAIGKSAEYFKDLASEGWKIVSTKMIQSASMLDVEGSESLEAKSQISE
jgi:hypothetical protein